MKATLVEKTGYDRYPCTKCTQVEELLHRDRLLRHVDRIVLADMRDPDSEGYQLARRYRVERAPLFLVEQDRGAVAVFDSYLEFKRICAGVTAATIIS